jgi:hemerythrin-like domain-containing protein
MDPRRDTLRRSLLALGAGALVLPAACAAPLAKDKDAKDVGAVEDLMREHGVLRRALRIYDQLAERLKAGDGGFDATVLAGVAGLFRDFGENYHERMLEEAFIFPRVKKAGGRAAGLADILQAQHERGRDITDYVQNVSKGGKVSPGDVAPLGQALRSMVTMYENHAAREDTIIFPAWKAALTGKELQEAGEQFEAIEKKEFGGDGFDDAEARISQYEQRLGYTDLGQFTAPAPPTPSSA